MRPVNTLLKEHKLRTTSSRSEILKLFIDKGHALSYTNIEQELSSSFDRVTVYRTLIAFLEGGIIHKVLNDDGILKYALCRESCQLEEHHHNHVHFKCEQCGETQCVEAVKIPAINLPRGYRVREMNLLIQGTCQRCQARNLRSARTIHRSDRRS